MQILFVCLHFLILIVKSSCDQAKHWAVLVAGSNGYYNYRHQADICHAYQILRQNGIPDERIIVMMYDDIANDTNNPTKGIIVNNPKGHDVYHDVPKDYVGRNVTPEVFLSVLLGNSTYLKDKGSGKYLASGPEDHVFVNFADHGAPGLVAFPNGELYARQLIQTIEIMHELKKYHKMVLYVEACESGSMFKGLLPDDVNVYATTAANREESSYACYWDDLRETFLGDVYSVRWMEDADQRLVNAETLADQYNIVKAETNTSHVQQFGDIEMGSHFYVGEFVGTERFVGEPVQRQRAKPAPIKDAVPAPEVPIKTLERRYAKARTETERAKIYDQLKILKKNRLHLDQVVISIEQRARSHYSLNVDLTSSKPICNYACFERVVRHFSTTCAPFSNNDYSLRKVQNFVNLCESGIETESIFAAISLECGNKPPLIGVH